METNRQQGGVYTLEKEDGLFIHYYDPDSYSYPKIKVHKTFTGKLIIEVKQEGATSEQFMVNELLIKVSNIKYKEIEIKELY